MDRPIAESCDQPGSGDRLFPDGSCCTLPTERESPSSSLSERLVDLQLHDSSRLPVQETTDIPDDQTQIISPAARTPEEKYLVQTTLDDYLLNQPVPASRTPNEVESLKADSRALKEKLNVSEAARKALKKKNVKLRKSAKLSTLRAQKTEEDLQKAKELAMLQPRVHQLQMELDLHVPNGSDPKPSRVRPGRRSLGPGMRF